MAVVDDKTYAWFRETQLTVGRGLIKLHTSFTIAVPEDREVPYIMLVDSDTREVLKRANLMRMLGENRSDVLLEIYRRQLEKGIKP